MRPVLNLPTGAEIRDETFVKLRRLGGLADEARTDRTRDLVDVPAGRGSADRTRASGTLPGWLGGHQVGGQRPKRHHRQLMNQSAACSVGTVEASVPKWAQDRSHERTHCDVAPFVVGEDRYFLPGPQQAVATGEERAPDAHLELIVGLDVA